MPLPSNLPILNTKAYDTGMQTAFVATNAIFDPYMIPHPIPNGADSITWNLGGESEALVPMNTYFGETTFQNYQAKKRTFVRSRWNAPAMIVDRHEKLSINLNPDGAKIQAMTRKVAQKRNEIFIANFETDVAVTDILNNDGSTTNTLVSFLSSNIVPKDYLTAGTNSGLTLEKLDALIVMAERNNLVGDEFATQYGYSLHMLMTEEIAASLLRLPQATSRDYADFFVRDNMTGKLIAYRGIKFIYAPVSLPTYTAGADRIAKLYAWHPSAFIYDPATLFNRTVNEDPLHTFNGFLYTELLYNTMRVREEAAFRIDAKLMPLTLI